MKGDSLRSRHGRPATPGVRSVPAGPAHPVARDGADRDHDRGKKVTAWCTPIQCETCRHGIR
jgi:hypothetical protein